MKIADQIYHCQISSRVAQAWRLQCHLEPAKLVWLECYTQIPNQLDYGDFSQVTFNWDNGQAKHPQWKAIAPETAQALINEALRSA